MLKEEEEDILAGGACVRRNECWCKLQLWMPKSCYFTPEMFTSILSPICNNSRRNRESRDFSSYRLARIVNSKSVGPRPRCCRIKWNKKQHQPNRLGYIVNTTTFFFFFASIFRFEGHNHLPSLSLSLSLSLFCLCAPIWFFFIALCPAGF